MCPANARRSYHSVRWVHSASSIPTKRLGRFYLFSSQLSTAGGAIGGSARWMAVLWTFCEFSLCRHARREFMRSALLDFIPIIPATVCHQRNYVERYGRRIGTGEVINKRKIG